MTQVNHENIVEICKRQLQDWGIPLAGPEGAGRITMLVAWTLRDEGAGLLVKTAAQNHFEFPPASEHYYGVDIICYPDGTIYDILGDSGGLNTPQWNLAAGSPAPASLYHPAIDPGFAAPVPIPVPEPLPEPAPPTILDFVAMVTTLLASIDTRLKAVEAQLAAQLAVKPAPITFPNYTGNTWLGRITLTPSK